MKKRCFLLFLIGFSLIFPLSIQVQARSMIYDILAKGSKWSLNVDGEVGILELLGGRGKRTHDGGWEMTMETRWQGNPGSLSATADGKNLEQRVILNVQRKNGLRVTCEGYIAMETDRFMAGVTRHRAVPKDIYGAWYATKSKKVREELDYGRRTVARKPVTSTAVKPQVVTPISPVAAGKCSISGKVYGPGAHAAKVFFISLYGPDNLTALRETKKFDREGGYTFTGLPKGKYKLIVDSKADTAIGPHPPHRFVECDDSGAIQDINFELK